MNFKINSITNQRQVFTALVLTGILSVSSGMSLLKSATAAPVNSTVGTSDVITQNTRLRELPRSVTNAVIRDLSRRQGIVPSNVEIVQYTPETWNNGCLQLPKSGELCTQALVPGWRVVASDGRQNWVYHTNRTGRTLRLNSGTVANNNNNNAQKLPAQVREAVLNAASRRLKVSVRQLTIIQAKKRDWRDGCLEIADSDRICTQAIVPGWRVVVGANEKALVYHTNDKGSVVRINLAASETNNKNLPQKVSQVVLKAASQYTKLPISELRVVDAQEVSVNGSSCLGLPKPGEPCTRDIGRAWKVTVEAGKQRLVYHAKTDASEVRLNLAGNNTYDTANLPKNIAEQILAQASQQSEQPVSRLQIVEAQRKQWPDSCLGINKPGVACAQIVVPGWQVTVSDGQQRWVYRVGEATAISLDKEASDTASRDNLKTVPIPVSELPPRLENDVVFRQISSGGFAGLTYETVLLNDGRLIRVRMGDANVSDRRVYHISAQQMQEFQQILEQRGKDFNNIAYSTSAGSADYIVYTLTSPNGTVQFSDISQKNLPSSLKTVVKTWNEISSAIR